MSDPFEAAGTLRGAYRGTDWAASPLGPVASWSPTLRGAVDVLLNTRSPVTLMWGPQFILVYNEAYVAMIGDKHPAALGAPARTVFAEIWDEIGPMLDSVAAGRGATWVEDMQLLMDRHGFTEETYFTFSYSPVRGPSGEIEGVIDIVSETTRQVIGNRRLRLLARLNDVLGDLDDLEDLRRTALPVLRTATEDLPGVDLLVPEVPADALPSEPAVIDRDARVQRTADGTRAYIRLTGGPQARDFATLVTGLSPHLAADEEYLGFLNLVGGSLAQGLNRIRVRQAERRHAVMEREMSEVLQRSLLAAPAQPENLQVAVRYRPAAQGAQIGGDWYDSFLQPDGQLTVVVGDVTGHDRHAAAAMSQIRNLLRGISYAVQKPPARVLSALNDAMAGLRVNVLATAVLAQIDPGTTVLRWSNAGHPPPVLLTPDGTAHLLEPRPETLLGTRFAGRRSDHEAPMEPGTAVILYTDGLVERRGVSLDVGLQDLRRALSGRQDLDAEQICDHLLAHFAETTDDDVCLAVVRVRP